MHAWWVHMASYRKIDFLDLLKFIHSGIENSSSKWNRYLFSPRYFSVLILKIIKIFHIWSQNTWWQTCFSRKKFKSKNCYVDEQCFRIPCARNTIELTSYKKYWKGEMKECNRKRIKFWNTPIVLKQRRCIDVKVHLIVKSINELKCRIKFR